MLRLAQLEMALRAMRSAVGVPWSVRRLAARSPTTPPTAATTSSARPCAFDRVHDCCVAPEHVSQCAGYMSPARC
eukprot:11002653-Lingulodinium_polyedra.AAC.1